MIFSDSPESGRGSFASENEKAGAPTETQPATTDAETIGTANYSTAGGGGRHMADPLHLTRLTAINPSRLSKRFMRVGDTVDKKPGGNLVEGIAERLTVDGAAAFASLLPTLTPGQALVYGINGHPQARVLAKNDAHKAGGDLPVIARTRDFFHWPDGAGILMMDYDPATDGPPLSRDELRAALVQACPALAVSPAVWRPSASSCIYMDGVEHRGIMGQRLYILVKNAADIPRAGQVIFDRLWLAEFGRYDLSKSGAFLNRSLIDASVFQPERLDFCGGADCRGGVTQRLPDPVLFNATAPYLDTEACIPDLTAEERQRLAHLQETYKTSLRERQAQVRETWIGERVDERVKALPETEQATARPVLERVYRQAAHGGWLAPDFALTVVLKGAKGAKAGKVVTVATVLAQRAKYHEATTLDPLEPDYPEGDSRLVGWLNLEAKPPYLVSHAHGGARYFLGVEPTAGSGQRSPQQLNDAALYREGPAGIFWVKETEDGTVNVPLANFTARFVSETLFDDGAETRRLFDIVGQMAGTPLPTVTVASNQFAAMNWVTSAWGTQAVISPGFTTKDRLRHAIQVLSNGGVQQRHVFGHAGWRRINECWLYLFQGGAIGESGLQTEYEVELPGQLRSYELSLPDDPAEALRASMRLLALAPVEIAAPLFLAPYRALLGEALPGDFSVFVSGTTGTRKTEAAAVVQAHFGADWSGRRLPAAWSATGNSLERLAFAAKDAVLTVDDFCPTGSATDIARFHREADRILRAQGNRAGRARMNADGSLRPDYFPRGLILATGEDLPRGQSLRGRLLVLEFGPDTVNLPVLTELQEHAADGLLAGAAGAFCQWLAPRLDALKAELPARVRRLRNEIAQGRSHARMPDTVAGLVATAETFAQFAADHGVTLPATWLADIQAALLATGQAQAQHQSTEEPARRFILLITAALSSGRAHVKRLDGKQPYVAEDMTGLGWQLKTFGLGESERTDWHEQGPCIGRFEDDSLYLDPEASYAAAQRLAGEQGQALTVSQRTLAKALDQRGYLLTRNSGSVNRLTLQLRMSDGSRRRFLHIRRVGVQNTGDNGDNGDNDAQVVDSDKNYHHNPSGDRASPSGDSGDNFGAALPPDSLLVTTPETLSPVVVTTPETLSPVQNPSGDKSHLSKPLSGKGKDEPVTTVTTVTTFAHIPPSEFSQESPNVEQPPIDADMADREIARQSEGEQPPDPPDPPPTTTTFIFVMRDGSHVEKQLPGYVTLSIAQANGRKLFGDKFSYVKEKRQ